MDNPIYDWYYITQAMFHEGGETWKSWNRDFLMSLIPSQTIVPNAIEDTKGNLVDIGYWKPCAESEWTHGFSYNTTLCALQLMVYYRYLPTFKTPEAFDEQAEELGEADNDEVEIEIQI